VNAAVAPAAQPPRYERRVPAFRTAESKAGRSSGPALPAPRSACRRAGPSTTPVTTPLVRFRAITPAGSIQYPGAGHTNLAPTGGDAAGDV